MTDENGFSRETPVGNWGTISEVSSPAFWPLIPDFLRTPAVGAMLTARPGNGGPHLIAAAGLPPLLTSDRRSPGLLQTTSRSLRRGRSAFAALTFFLLAVSLGFPPGGQRPDARGSPGPSWPIQRLRKARGGPRDLPWRRASRQA